MHDRSDSIETLRQRSEHCRAELKHTIDELSGALSDTTDEIKTTFSPHHLKQEARVYAREKRAAVVAAVKDHVESNPLQALVIGAALSYPLLGIARKVPVPLVLLGAGLFLARNRASTTSRANMPIAEAAEDFGENIHAGAEETATESATSESSAEEAVAASATSRASRPRSATSPGAGLRKWTDGSGDAVRNLIERNPLLVGGLAIAMGGLIAASLPASRTEAQVLGQARGVVKEKTRKAAAEAVRGVKARAAEIADDISAAAEQEGLTTEALGEAVDTATDKVASVVTRAVDEAIGSEPAERSSEARNNGGRNAKL